MTLGAAVDKAKVSLSRDLSFPFQRSASCHRAVPVSSSPERCLSSPAMVTSSRSAASGNSAKNTGRTRSNFESSSTAAELQPVTSGRTVFKLSPHIPYRPTPGLVALFAKTGTPSRSLVCS